MVDLASVYLNLHEFDLSLHFVARINSLTDMPYDYFHQTGDAYLAKKAFGHATRAYEYAIERGLDTAYVIGLKEKFPQVKR